MARTARTMSTYSMGNLLRAASTLVARSDDPAYGSARCRGYTTAVAPSISKTSTSTPTAIVLPS